MRTDELRIYDLLVTVAEEIDRLGVPGDAFFSWGHSGSFGQRGTRTNGWQALSAGLPGVVPKGERYLQRLEEERQNIDEAIAMITAAITEIRGTFVVCGACEGQQGQMGPEPESWDRIREWEDCSRCAGRGVLPRGAAVWQDEGRTYTPPEQQLDTRIDGQTERREAA